jgi:hypothetical protein
MFASAYSPPLAFELAREASAGSWDERCKVGCTESIESLGALHPPLLRIIVRNGYRVDQLGVFAEDKEGKQRNRKERKRK